MKIPESEQIEAILMSSEVKLAEKYGIDESSQIPWTVSRDHIKSYISKNGFPDCGVHFSEKTFDGVYFVPIGHEWRVCYQERGIICYDKRFPSKDLAMDYLLDHYFLRRLRLA